MIDIESIGSRVKYHRLRNKISQEELAELAQVSRVHISYLERGERIPSMESFINIANALNVSADELLANNLLVTGSNMNSEEQNILFDCSVNERQILLSDLQVKGASHHRHGFGGMLHRRSLLRHCRSGNRLPRYGSEAGY